MTAVPLLIGLRYAGGSAGSLYLSFISRVSLIGLVLGVVALTVVVSVMNGFDRELKYRILGTVPHVVITGGEPSRVEAWLAEQPGVQGYARFIQRAGLLLHGSSNKLVAMYGVDAEREALVSILPDHIVAGNMGALTPGSGALLLGRPLAFQLGLVTGDSVTLIVPEPSAGGNAVAPRLARLRVAGFFEVDAEVDYSLVLMNRDDLAQVAGDTSIAYRVTLDDVFRAPGFAAAAATGIEGATASDWTDEFGDFFETVRMEKIMMFVLLTLVVAIAAFNIVSGLSMMVREKRADIAVLRTLGLSPRAVMVTFMIQGSVVGVLGTALGLLIGIPLAWSVSDIVSFLEGLAGANMLAGTYFDRLPSDIRGADLLVIALVSLVISLTATLYPAYRASRLQPADVLRYE